MPDIEESLEQPESSLSVDGDVFFRREVPESSIGIMERMRQQQTMYDRVMSSFWGLAAQQIMSTEQQPLSELPEVVAPEGEEISTEQRSRWRTNGPLVVGTPGWDGETVDGARDTDYTDEELDEPGVNPQRIVTSLDNLWWGYDRPRTLVVEEAEPHPHPQSRGFTGVFVETTSTPTSNVSAEPAFDYGFTQYIRMNDDIVRVLDEMKREHNDKIARRMLNGMTYNTSDKDYIDYLGIASVDNTKISYLNKARLATSITKGSDLWTTKSRYMANSSSVVEKLFPSIYTGREKENFTTLYRHIVSKACLEDLEIEIVHGEDIRYWYYGTRYKNDTQGGGSELQQSCMKHEVCQQYLDIYVKNPKQIGMAIIKDKNDLLMARAILWWPDGVGTKKYYHDRIYAISSEIKRGMQSKLEVMDFINISDRNDIAPKKDYKIDITLDVGEKDFRYVPYMDTMFCLKGNIISNHQTDWRQLRDTDGGREICHCECCNEEYEDSDLHFVNSRLSAHFRHYLCDDCATWSEYIDSYLHRTEVVKTYDGEYTHTSRSVTLYNGLIADCNDDNLRESARNEWFTIPDAQFAEFNGYYWNIDSKDYKELIKVKQVS